MDKRDSILAKAEEAYRIYNQYPVPIEKVAEHYGFNVLEANLSSSISGYILINDEFIEKYNSNKIILVNSNNTYKRRRFTIAHELGHYLLEVDKDDRYYAFRDETNQGNDHERAADSFAANLLMPEKLINKEIENYKNAADFYGDKWTEYDLVYYISRIFNVSEPAARVRLRYLKVVQ